MIEQFERVRLIEGEEAFERIRSLRVALFGVGGVGSWCAEALVRTGVAKLMLVDFDTVAPSNLNRQLPALASTIGRPKVEVLAERLRDINSEVDLEIRNERYTPETADSFALERFDCVVDAIDSLDCKVALIRHALAIPTLRLYSSMGAALKTDITKIRLTPFKKVEYDGLARALRNRFRKTGGIPERPFMCVWNPEQRKNALPAPPKTNGTLMHITAAFGLALAQLVIDSTHE